MSEQENTESHSNNDLKSDVTPGDRYSYQINECEVCQSEELEITGDGRLDKTRIYKTVTCSNCNSVYREEFVLVNSELLQKEPKK